MSDYYNRIEGERDTPVVQDCWGRKVSALRANTARYACPFCRTLLATTTTTCINPACDAAPWVTREIALERAREQAVQEDARRDRERIYAIRQRIEEVTKDASVAAARAEQLLEQSARRR